jgi:hypothetical protein
MKATRGKGATYRDIGSLVGGEPEYVDAHSGAPIIAIAQPGYPQAIGNWINLPCVPRFGRFAA